MRIRNEETNRFVLPTRNEYQRVKDLQMTVRMTVTEGCMHLQVPVSIIYSFLTFLSIVPQDLAGYGVATGRDNIVSFV